MAGKLSGKLTWKSGEGQKTGLFNFAGSWDLGLGWKTPLGEGKGLVTIFPQIQRGKEKKMFHNLKTLNTMK